MKKFTMAVIFILIIGGLGFIASVDEEGDTESKASIERLMDQTSNREGDPQVVVASYDSPYYALIGTPLALWYDELGVQNKHPLVVAEPGDPSSAVERFLLMYDNEDLVVLGDAHGLDFGDQKRILGDPKDVSIEVARTYWSSSLGAMLVQENQLGYNMATMVMPLASYLNLPVIVTDSTDGRVKEVLRELGVEFTIVCGSIGGYGDVMRFPRNSDDSQIFTDFDTAKYAIDVTRQVLEQRLGTEATYITLANPLDIHENRPIDTIEFKFSGMVGDSSSGNYPGAAPDSPDGPIHGFEIPDGWNYALLKIDVMMDVSEATGLSAYTLPEIIADLRVEGNAHDSGERIYIYLGRDGNTDGTIDGHDPQDTLLFFGGSPGYEYICENPDDPTSKPLRAHFYTELAMVNSIGPLDIQALARLPTVDSGEAEYRIDIAIDKIQPVKGKFEGVQAEIPIYPLMPKLSSLSGYLTAYHKGLTLAKPQYILHSPGYVGCSGCGVPAANEQALDEANKSAIYVKKEVNWLLSYLHDAEIDPRNYEYVDWHRVMKTKNYDVGEMPEELDQIVALASSYQRQFYDGGVEFNLGIIGDTNMIPQYYYPTGQSEPTEGFGCPSDNIYSDIDADPYDPPYDLRNDNDHPYKEDMSSSYEPDFEIGVGRVDGWDSQDASALIARTAFYLDIIDAHDGPVNDGITYPDEWKNTAYTTLGTIPPCEVAANDLYKFEEMAKAAGFGTGPEGVEDYNQMSRRQYTQDEYESANMMFFCAHGFYYWYVPTAQEGVDGIPDPVSRATYGGGAYDVAHVKDMSFGPTVIFASSCVTGRIDGLYSKNALALAFLHAGMNAYIGATRMSWGTLLPLPDSNSDATFGDYLALRMYANFFGYIYDKSGTVVNNNLENLGVGMALMDAKNRYSADKGTDNEGPHNDTINEFILHGDPAFNPYEPNHQG